MIKRPGAHLCSLALLWAVMHTQLTSKMFSGHSLLLRASDDLQIRRVCFPEPITRHPPSSSGPSETPDCVSFTTEEIDKKKLDTAHLLQTSDSDSRLDPALGLLCITFVQGQRTAKPYLTEEAMGSDLENGKVRI